MFEAEKSWHWPKSDLNIVFYKKYDEECML